MNRAARTLVVGAVIALACFGIGSRADVAGAVPLSDSATDSTDRVLAAQDTTVDIPLAIDTAMTVSKVTISVDFAKVGAGGTCGPPAVNGSAPPRNDGVFMQLTSPEGTPVQLIYWSFSYAPESGFGGRVTMTFDDDATAQPSSQPAPTTGTYDPQFNLMTDFVGQQALGNWVLRLNRGFEFTVEGGALCFYGTTLTVNGDGVAPPTPPQPVCIKAGEDWRAPYSSGLCPSGFAQRQIVTGASGGPDVCIKKTLDWRAPGHDNACPVGFARYTIPTTTEGGIPVCIKVDWDWRAPYTNGLCPSGFTRVRAIEASLPR